jgi:hypothetical protein
MVATFFFWYSRGPRRDVVVSLAVGFAMLAASFHVGVLDKIDIVVCMLGWKRGENLSADRDLAQGINHK